MASTTVSKTLKRHPKCSSFYSTTTRPHDARAAELAPMTPSIAYLEQLTMHMTVSKALKGCPQYAMTVYHKKTKATWRNCRDFEEYTQFQTRLVRAMSRGHFCYAECPWLYTFVKRAFPKPSFFNYSSPRVVELRRKALNRFFNTLQAVLLNHSNHGCSTLTNEVAKEFVGFIYGGASDSAPWENLSPVARGGTLARTFSETFMSVSSTSEEEGDGEDAVVAPGVSEDYHANERECCAMCALHQVRSDEQVFAWWQAKSRFEREKPAPMASESSEPVPTYTMQSPFAYAHSPEFHHYGAAITPAKAKKFDVTSRDASNQLTLIMEPGMSPFMSLADTAVLGDEEIAVLGHDGTPKEAYPGTPKSSFHSTSMSGWTNSSLSSPPPLSFLQDDDDDFFSKSAYNPSSRSNGLNASAAQTKRECTGHNSMPTPTFLHKRIRTLPRRSLNVWCSVSNALSQKLKSSQQHTF
ncbi:hypothetical protein FI667_g8985, partial [Globisporangium splendens]